MPSDEKKKKKRKRREHESSSASSTADDRREKNVGTDKEALGDVAATESREQRRVERERKKSAKKAEKSSLLEKVPKVDEDGIAYTKIQIRRMLRRVKRGLPPVPTEEEERERLREIKKEKRMEEEELAGMIFDRQKEKETEEDNSNESGGGEEGGKDMDLEDEEGRGQEGHIVAEGNVPGGRNLGDNQAGEGAVDTNRPNKKKMSAKPVPPDYVCQACKNKHSPPHWIYDCPDKVRRPGTNQVRKNMKGINMPDPRKVYVSGMPFGVKHRDVRVYFEDKAKCGKIAKCHLVTFQDESARCKGEAFITFETEEGAKSAIATSGGVMEIGEKNDKKGEKRGGGGGSETKNLQLKVTKVRNKATTRRKNMYFSMRRKGQ